jgi:ectoine hydroxylase-related dioxygenase (phytanoyl-CoA dioxygenase family)
MMTGDVLIFNHRLVHGSSSNHSNKNRRSIVLRATNVDENKITNKEEFLKETKIRTNFVVDTFSVINKKIKNKNKYSDFLVDKKND